MKKLLAAAMLVCSMSGAVVNISDTLTSAVGGGPWTGTITITLYNPGSAQPLYNGTVALAGYSQTLCVGVARDGCSSRTAAGAVTVALYANDSITPAGTSYRAAYLPTRGGGYTETWVVGATTTTLIAIRATTVPVPTVTLSPTQLSSGGATSGQVLAWNGTSWAPATPGGALTTTAVIDAVATPDGACVLDTTAVTVTGAALGGRPTIGSSLAWPEAIKIEAKVTGPNTVKLEICNHSGASYNPASATYYFGVYP